MFGITYSEVETKALRQRLTIEFLIYDPGSAYIFSFNHYSVFKVESQIPHYDREFIVLNDGQYYSKLADTTFINMVTNCISPHNPVGRAIVKPNSRLQYYLDGFPFKDFRDYADAVCGADDGPYASEKVMFKMYLG